MPPEKNTTRGEFDRSVEEFQELDHAIKLYDGTPQAKEEIGGEAADVIIRMLGIAAVVGANMGEVLEKKINETVGRKYPASLIKSYQEMGFDWDQSMAKAKTVYQNQRQIPTGNGAFRPPPQA